MMGCVKDKTNAKHQLSPSSLLSLLDCRMWKDFLERVVEFCK